MSRMARVINFTCTDANTWYKIFDEDDYRNNRIQHVKIKLREDTDADYFRYNYDKSTTIFMTSTSGWELFKDLKKLYAYIPDVAAAIIEIEIIYK